MRMNKTRLRVSIVIPAYNEERHLSACLQAIAKQSVLPDEVIVVDNNSSDKTAKVAQAFPFVRVIHEKRVGRVFARNAGFDAVAGDIIGRIDADITLPPDWVAHVKAFYAKPESLRSAWTGGGYFSNIRLPRLVAFGYALLAFRFNRLLIGHPTLWGSNMAITAAQWQQVRSQVCLRNDIHEDLDLAMHVHDAGYTITYDETIQVAAELKRVQSNRHELWDYLQWWPRTLRSHGKRSWIVCWTVGALLLYIASFGWWLIDSVGRSLGRLSGVRPK